MVEILVVAVCLGGPRAASYFVQVEQRIGTRPLSTQAVTGLDGLVGSSPFKPRIMAHRITDPYSLLIKTIQAKKDIAFQQITACLHHRHIKADVIDNQFGDHLATRSSDWK